MKNILLSFIALLFVSGVGAQAPGTVKSATRISAKAGSLGVSPNWKLVGKAAVSYPDLDGDGIRELAFSALDSRPSGGQGIFIYKLNSNGEIKPGNPIILSKLTPPLNTLTTKYPGYNDASQIGASMTMLKDLNGNGVDELVAGDPTNSRLYVLFMNGAGTADSVVLIENGKDGFSLYIGGGNFGLAVANVGDIDGDGIEDIATYAATQNRSDAMHVLFMKSDGRVKKRQAIANNEGGIGALGANYGFGFAPSSIGDLDQDGTPDIVVGANPTSNNSVGEFWTLFMKPDGTVKNYKITKPNTPAFTDVSNTSSGFGSVITPIGDLDGDSIVDVAISSAGFVDSLGANHGRVYIFFMKRDGQPKAWQAIDRYNGNLPLSIDTFSAFGVSLFAPGDFNKDGIFDLGIGASNSRETGIAPPPGPYNGTGAIYMLALNGIPITTSVGDQLHNLTDSYFLYPNPTSDYIRIRSRKPLATALQVRLLDAAGRIVKEASGEGSTTLEIEVAHLPAGLYHIVMESGKEVQRSKFIKK